MTRRNVSNFSFLFSIAINITHIEKKHAKLKDSEYFKPLVWSDNSSYFLNRGQHMY